MKCINHLEKDAVGVCNYCGKNICSDCQVEVKGENYCKGCVVIKINKEQKQERSPALAAILSFIISGLGQIYNSQIGKGILLFFAVLLVAPGVGIAFAVARMVKIGILASCVSSLAIWLFGIIDAYKTAKKINRAEIIVKSRPGCLIAAIIGIVVFFVGIAFLALLAAIAIPNVLRARINANEHRVEATLNKFSKAIEDYRAANNGDYPQNEFALVLSKPSYLDQTYNTKTIAGYTFFEEFYPDGYKIIAAPKECGATGIKVFIIETGGVLSSQDCKEEQ